MNYEVCCLACFNSSVMLAMKTKLRFCKLTDILFPLLMLCLATRRVLNWTSGEHGSTDVLHVFLYGFTEIVLIVVLLIYGIYLCIRQWKKFQQSKGKWRIANLLFVLVIVLACLDLCYWTFSVSHPDVLAFLGLLQTWF